MAIARPCAAQLSRLSIQLTKLSSPALSIRLFHTPQPLLKGGPKPPRKKKDVAPKSMSSNQAKKKKEAMKKKKKSRTSFKEENIEQLPKFSLVDAMRYIRAAEAGQNPAIVKYDLAVKLTSPKNGPVIRNRLRLPHPVKTDIRICVICPPDSKYAIEAKEAGAVLVGEESIFEAIKDGKIEFDRCICQLDSLEKLNKAQLGRVLGPKGLMPSTKMGTVVKNPADLIKDMVGGAEYREKLGVLRIAVGQLGHSPLQLQKNLTAFMAAIKTDMAQIAEKVTKTIAEVVLSSTHGPGLTLNGKFKEADSINPKSLSGVN
ncbi:unnamed protein product [Blumeria hordei]|uniref:50S ribosomal protein L1 n=1 Tax=Blumeria hordei TaxID=2867405 RepID=A0A383V2R2_BLUHO|nr:unnamed protein product [Blumeria hordei]